MFLQLTEWVTVTGNLTPINTPQHKIKSVQPAVKCQVLPGTWVVGFIQASLTRGKVFKLANGINRFGKMVIGNFFLADIARQRIVKLTVSPQ
jgi:hypothetical protein